MEIRDPVPFPERLRGAFHLQSPCVCRKASIGAHRRLCPGGSIGCCQDSPGLCGRGERGERSEFHTRPGVWPLRPGRAANSEVQAHSDLHNLFQQAVLHIHINFE